MKARIVVFCFLLILILFILGCNSAVNEISYKYKIYVGSGGIQNHVVYSDDFTIDANGFLTVVNPKVMGESRVGRVICSPGTYFILER
jgi:hypothetical protein